MRTRGGLQNGVFGAAVVGLVLLASLGMAFLANADEREIDTTNWDYVTSANPAFTYDNAPARIDYSPPANYTGYSTTSGGSSYTSGINYTVSSSPTAYLAKTAPTYTGNGTISYSVLHTRGLEYLGNQNNNWSYNNVLNRSMDSLTWYSPASLMSLSNISEVMAVVLDGDLHSNTTIILNSNSDNLYFVLNSTGADSFAGVNSALSPRYYTFDGPICDKVVVDANTGAATLYNDSAVVSVTSVNDVLIGVTAFTGSPSAADLADLTLTYTVFYTNDEYMNPIYGVSPIPPVASYPSLTSAASLDSTQVYSSVNLTGEDIVTTYGVGAPNGRINLTLKVVLGATITTTAYNTVGNGSAWIYAIKDFNWTAEYAGNYILDITDNIAGYWEWATKLYVEVVNPGSVYWFNGYDNAAADLLVQSFNGTLAAGSVNIVCNSDAWTIGGVAVGTWPAMIISYDMDDGITARPVSSFTNFGEYTEAGTEIIISDSALGLISSLAFYTTADVNMSIIKTTVYVENGGVYRVNSYLDVSSKFPTYDTYNITITGAPHWGDSISINGTVCAVDPSAGTVTVGGVAFPLAGLVLAYSDEAFYYRGAQYDAGHLVALNGDLAADLGAAAGLVLQFNGTWYYETQLYEGTPGTVTVLDWTPGVLGLEPAAFSAVFTLLSLVGLVLASRLGGGLYDYLVLGSAVLVGFIMCGVFL